MILQLEQVAGEREDDLLPVPVLDRELGVGREHRGQRAVDHALRLDLTFDAPLDLAVQGASPSELPWLDAPPTAAYGQAIEAAFNRHPRHDALETHRERDVDAEALHV